MKKILITLAVMAFMPLTVFGASVNLDVDKTNLSTDDVAHIKIIVEGSIDGGQVGIQGLEDFNVVGQSSSQSIQIINGQTAQVQEKELTVQPKSAGSFEITALAQENGTTITSDTITLNVDKSLQESTKDSLLNGILNNDEQQDQQQAPSPTTTQPQVKVDPNEIKDDFPKKDLLTTQKEDKNQETNNDTQENDEQQLNVNPIKDFPNVKHISPFNTMFWLQFLTIVLLLVGIFGIIAYIIQKKNKK
jgi:hypothetical protein